MSFKGLALDLPFRTLSDLEKAGLELYVTCQKCRRQKLIEVTAKLRDRRVASQRFRTHVRCSWVGAQADAATRRERSRLSKRSATRP